MSEFTWYCRLLVWVGAVILLIESVFRRTTGFVTLVGVLALALGLLGFAAGLVLDARPMPAFLAPALAEADGDMPTSGDERSFPPSEPPSSPVLLPPGADVPNEDVIEVKASDATASARSRGAIAVDVTGDGSLAGAICPACHNRLRPGEVAARCGECGTPQHAACWVGNRFHCAREGCGGEGPLAAAGSGEESSGPSTV